MFADGDRTAAGSPDVPHQAALKMPNGRASATGPYSAVSRETFLRLTLLHERRLAMRRHEGLRFTASWIALLLTGFAILVYGLVVIVLHTSDEQYLGAIGVASVGMGLFGVMITLTAFRRRERWAFFSLWYYPAFWLAHLVGNLPPGRDHVHQVVFIALSLLGLLLPIGEFFPRG